MNFGKWIGFICLIISLSILWQIRQLVLLLFTAVFLADALNLVVLNLQQWNKIISKRQLKRNYAVLLTIILFLGIISGFFLIVVPSFVLQFQELAQLFPQGIEQLIISLNILKEYLPFSLREALPDLKQLIAQLQPLINQLLDSGWIFFSSGIGVVLNSLLLLVLTLMFLSDPQPYRRGFIRLFPSFYRRRVNQIMDRCDQDLRGWVVEILFNLTMITILSFIALLILGISLPLAQAMLAGIFTFIPHLGSVLSAISPMLISLLGEKSWKAIAILIIYLVIQQIQEHIIIPQVLKNKVNILPAVTLFSQLCFATFFGVMGLFLALPMIVVGKRNS